MATRTRYANLDREVALRTWRELLKWREERKRKKKDLSFTVPRESQPDIAFLLENRTETVVVWIGHSTFLLQIGGLNILTDPVWSTNSPYMRRLSPPGLLPDQLPPIDAVVISHAHYDHLQFSSLRKIPGNPHYYVPAGLAGKMARKGFTPVQELNWWESAEQNVVRLHFVPAQHWSRRTPWDTNTSHWGGWVIEGGGETVYFVGDSGYFRGFRDIGERFSVDVALMPIGAYEPEWFMGPQHVTPEEAVKAFLDVKAGLFIPMHYGAFRLADDTPKEALDRLFAAWEARGLPAGQLKIPKLGELVRV